MVTLATGPAPDERLDALGDVTTITRLLKRNESQVRNHLVCLPDFPKAIRLPVSGGPRLYRAAEVLVWVGKY